ncbi:quercetin 2,3-dioxygenase [Gottfriedia solisilvae]|uniref:quercetin 2,3-dioxygenase n=1 Tax=Gottfriedia solisilvae TaxID=1516104 RepID=UPI003D2EE612
MAFKNNSLANIMHRTISEDNTYYFLINFASIIVSGEETDGAFSIVLCHGVQDSGPPLHIHELEDESFYILEGELTFRVGDETIHAKQGDYVFAPRGIPHTIKTISKTSKTLVTSYPAGFDRFVKELGIPYTKDFVKPDGPPSPETIKKLIEVSKNYKISYPNLES